MQKSEIRNPKSEIYLGVDGGQSHTEAVVADRAGNVLARGFGGASNHAEQPGGRARLRNAVSTSVGEALKNARLAPLEESVFVAAHFGMTGGADFKEEIISEIVRAELLRVGHDAPTALCGATAGAPGVVVIAGTGSVVYGENPRGETAQVGGLGYLFSDEGSGFWLAAQIVRLAIKEQDGLVAPSGLTELVLRYFERRELREVTNDFYFEKISRDRLASFARVCHDAALDGNEIVREQIRAGARVLAGSVGSVAARLGLSDGFPAAGVGGMFRGELVKRYFSECLRVSAPGAVFTEPKFNPAIGALLLAYRQAEIEITESLLANLENSRHQ